MSAFHVPEHVSKDRVFDIDYYNVPGAEDDHVLAWKELHKGPDIIWTPRNGGHWIVTRAADMDFILRTTNPFSSNSIAIPPESKPVKLLPSESNPPEHTQYRNIINPWFTPKAVGELEERIRKHCVDLIEGLRPRGGCEFVAEFASIVPIVVFLQLVNLPVSQRSMLKGMTEDAVRGPTEPDRVAAFLRLGEYMKGVIAERRADPGDDLLSRVVHAEVFGRPMNDAEIHSTCVTLMFGGLDTVAASMGFAARFLADNPGHRHQLRDNPALIPQAVNELLRRFGIAISARQVTSDYQYGEVLFKAGDGVSMPLWLHGVDERRFVNPLEVDFARKLPPNSTFASGPHRCPGSFLARTELKIFLEEWLKRIPDFGIPAGERPRLHNGSVVSVRYLPLTWTTH
jgi:cytochrome P450